MTYDIASAGTNVFLDVVFKHVGNVYYPIVNGPMHGLLFPFVETPEDGTEFSYDYYLAAASRNQRGDLCDDNYNHWPGLHRESRRPTSTLFYRFVSPYVYYLGERLALVDELV
jgi:hypothetical protein